MVDVRRIVACGAGLGNDGQLTPTTLSSTVDNVSTSFWPSKSYQDGRLAKYCFRTR